MTNKASHIHKDAALEHLRAGRFDQAEELLRALLDKRPDDAETLFHLGTVLARLGRSDDGLDMFRRAAALAPDKPAVWRNLGLCLFQMGRHDEALEALRKTCGLDPANPDPLADMAAVLSASGAREAAEAALRQALQLVPGHHRATVALAGLLVEQARYRDALPYLNGALEQEPDNLALLAGAGRANRECGQYDSAAAAYEGLLARDPGSTAACTGLALTRSAQGRLDEARGHYQAVLDRDPDNAVALANLAQIRRFTAEDRPLIDRMIERASRGGLTKDVAVLLEFSTGKALDDIADYDSAFDHFARGNRLAGPAVSFDPAAFTDLVERTIRVFDAAWFQASARWGADSDQPVFVVGMGRSGTSLVEQILASHGEAEGAGEVNYIEDLALSLRNPAGGEDGAASAEYPETLASLGPAEARRLGEAYLERLRTHAPGARHIVDKMPLNFQYLGLIATILPRARIVHCRRHPLDTCLSLFFQHFQDSQAYAYDLESLGLYYRTYRHMMAHWREVLPISMLDLDYEALVQNQETETRRLIEFCDLPWDPQCLKFHETGRAVQTASRWQARQAMYQRSVGRWRHYEAHLEPLRRALGEL